jgi:hypothetical protein
MHQVVQHKINSYLILIYIPLIFGGMGDSAAEKTKRTLDFTNSTSYISGNSYDYGYDCLLFYRFFHLDGDVTIASIIMFDCKELEKQQEAQRPHCLPESPWPILKDILFMYAFYFFFGGHNTQFQVMCKEDHSLETSQAYTCNLEVGISTDLEIEMYFLFKRGSHGLHTMSDAT